MTRFISCNQMKQSTFIWTLGPDSNHCAFNSQNSTIWWLHPKLVRKEVGLRSQCKTLMTNQRAHHVCLPHLGGWRWARLGRDYFHNCRTMQRLKERSALVLVRVIMCPRDVDTGFREEFVKSLVWAVASPISSVSGWWTECLILWMKWKHKAPKCRPANVCPHSTMYGISVAG